MNLTFPGGAVRVLGASAVAVTAPADTNENAMATITIPAGALGLNGILRVWANYSCTNNVNAKTLRIRYSGIGGTVWDVANAASVGMRTQLMMMANRGAANSQIFGYYGNNISQGNGTSAVDTTVATTLVLTATKGVGGDTITLDSYLVELLLP